MRVLIKVAGISLTATLTSNDTAKEIFKALPMQSKANRWGEEIYFDIPVSLPEAPDARQDMQVGELGYWPPGSAFCIFFGPTPASQDQSPRAASNVNPIGTVDADATLLTSVQSGATITLEALND
jgi:hypothetical protein